MENLINSRLTRTSPQLNICDLNDDCLLHLFSHLKLDDLVTVSTIYPRFKYIAEQLFPRRLQLWTDISDNDQICRWVLSEIGEFLTEMRVDDNYSGISIEETMDLVEKNCKNLKQIFLDSRIPIGLLNLPPNVTTIGIRFPENWILSDQFLEGLRKYNHLDSLSLKFCQFTRIDSAFLSGLPSLRYLHLKNCSIEPLNLYKCLRDSERNLESLALNTCFQECPQTLPNEIDKLLNLNRLELQQEYGKFDFGTSNIFRQLTSLKLSKAAANVNLDNLFQNLIEYNLIETLSLNLIENNKFLTHSTLKELHRLTSLKELFVCEADCVTDEFLMEISKSQNLTHFTYRQYYHPMLSFDAMIRFIVINGRNLEACSYNVYRDIIRMDATSEQKKELMETFRKTSVFSRILVCKEDISCRVTSVEFRFRKRKSRRC